VDFSTWLFKWDPTNFSFTMLFYLLVLAAIAILWFKLIPDYLKNERPHQRELRMKRLQADIDVKKDEVNEQRLMRQALEKQNSVAERIALLIEHHDIAARSGINDIMSLLRIVLQKQGVSPSEIAQYISKQETETQAILTAALSILQKNPPTLAEAKVN
jgi:hypothetical protein